jgi:hypothetical protein
MKRERNISFSRFLSQRFHFRPAIAILLSLSLFITSCTPFSIGPSARDRAQNVIKRLEAIPDELERETASVITLNAFCTLGRLASGSAEGRVEMALADYFADHPPEVRTEIQKMAKTLDKISASERTELLGRFAAYDPGPCASAPDWDGIGRSVIFSHRLMPRLRANFCSGNLVYSDATPADRAITVGSQVVFEAVEPDGGPSLFELASNASPVILGVEGEFVSARHPALAVTATTDGDGMSPYGAVTDIPCSLADDSGCDPNKGLVCSAKFGGTSGHCVAYPVVQKDHELILRGYNFWDIDQARLIFSPLFPGEGTESTTIVDVVDANEPTSGAEACPLPTPDNPTHNRAHFRVTANEGHFYKLRMYNHNGNFFTQFDALEDADPRVIHVCFPDSEDLTNLPEGTIRDCTLPAETCAQDGAKCAATWGTPPRKLEECRHLPGEPPACGETPEWFTSEPLTERADDVIFPTKDIIVYVENEEPQYEFKATLQSVEAKEETGWDWTGSDEPMLLLAGFPDEIPPGEDAEIIDKMDESSDAWKGGDYDTGTRKTEVQVLSSLDGLTSENEVLYLLILAEDDGFLAGFLAGAAVIVVVAAIIYLTGGAGLIYSLRMRIGVSEALEIGGKQCV